MSNERSDEPVGGDPFAELERAFIEEFLQRRGYSSSTLHGLPDEQAHALLTEASLYACGRLTEVESRAHFVDDIHVGAHPMPGPSHGRKA